MHSLTPLYLARADILGVSEQEVWRYGQELRALAQRSGCDNLRFSRLSHLLDDDELPEPQTEAQYVALAPKYRESIIARYLPRDFDVGYCIANDKDVNYTYCGYVQFLGLEMADTRLKGTDMPKTHKIRFCKDVARRMIYRGKVRNPYVEP